MVDCHVGHEIIFINADLVYEINSCLYICVYVIFFTPIPILLDFSLLDKRACKLLFTRSEMID